MTAQLSLFPPKRLVVALSGGKDSTALALALTEREPADYIFFCTPTGDEFPEMEEHWQKLEGLLGKALVRATNGTLETCIERNGALPNYRMRFCTRELKIVPALAFMARIAPAVMHVGLRADEEEREGIYSDQIEQRFPFREWGWRKPDVLAYLKHRGVTVPERTDCMRCPFQRLYEWKRLHERYPAVYADAAAQESRYGHTFRSPQRDSRPAALAELQEHFPMIHKRGNDEDAGGACRVCRL